NGGFPCGNPLANAGASTRLSAIAQPTELCLTPHPLRLTLLDLTRHPSRFYLRNDPVPSTAPLVRLRSGGMKHNVRRGGASQMNQGRSVPALNTVHLEKSRDQSPSQAEDSQARLRSFWGLEFSITERGLSGREAEP